MTAFIVISAVLVGVVGLLLGLFLGVASEKFAVKMDERESEIREALPGNNCGGCGYAGCDALAKAIASGEAKVDACPVGGAPVGAKIAAIMGVEAAPEEEKKVAFVHCSGTCDKTKRVYNYYGISDCSELSVLPNRGEKACQYACMGYGSCVKACQFGAMQVIDGVATVDKSKCVGCGACVSACPNGLIELVPAAKRHLVKCSSHMKGKQVKDACSAGCIGCTMCTRVCPSAAIHMENDLAVMDYAKCTDCGLCAQKCPSKVITA